MIYLQILVTIFIVFILLKLFLQKQKNKISPLAFFIWLFLWLVVLIVFWLPDTTSYLAAWLGIGRGADLVVYVSILLIFYMIFKIFIRLNKIEDEITRVVREDAIKNAKEK
jgi:small membrane protein